LKELGIKAGSWVQSELSGATFYSPGGAKAEFRTTPQAWVIDRVGFDRELAEAAARVGATFYLKTRCVGFSVEGKLRLEVRGEMEGEIECEVLVGADGPSSLIARKLGFLPREFTHCAQVEVPGDLEPEMASVWLGEKVAPGFFAWGVRVGELCRVGLGCLTGNPVNYLGKLLRKLGRGKETLTHCRGRIPRFFNPKPGVGRVLLVGDAAGQVKPLTGGGIYLGLSCSKLAAEAIRKAFDSGSVDGVGEKYSAKVQEEFGKDVRLSMIARELFRRLSDRKLDTIVSFMSKERVKQLVIRNFNFDRHGEFLSAIVKESPKLIKEAELARFLKGLLYLVR
jgi:flavin-dependent dehydrogenase